MFEGKMRFLTPWLFVSVMFMLNALPRQVQCQEKFPTRPIDLIVPYAAGGGTDLAARVIAPTLSKKWGVPVNVINKPGGNTVPAGLEVYQSAPDGYTIFMDGDGQGPMLEVAVKNLPFKIMDRTIICMITGSQMTLSVSSGSPYKTLEDAISDARKDPGNFTWTSLGGAGTIDAVMRQFFKYAAAIDITKTKPVMCRGSGETVVMAAGGHVKLACVSTAGALPAFKAGTIKILAITGKNRSLDYPNVPSCEELGYPKVNHFSYTAFSGPPKLSPYIVEKYEKVAEEILKDPEVISKLRNVGLLPLFENSRETREHFIRTSEDLRALWGLK